MKDEISQEVERQLEKMGLMPFGTKARKPTEEIPIQTPPAFAEAKKKIDKALSPEMSEKTVLMLHKANTPRRSNLPIIEDCAIKNGMLTTTDLEHTLMTPTNFNLSDGVYQRVGNDLVLTKAWKLEEWPEAPKLPKQVSVFSLSVDDIEQLSNAANFVSDDELRPAMCGVLIDNGKLVATNGHYLYLEPFPAKVKCVVDTKTIGLLKKAKMPATGVLHADKENQILVLRFGGATLTSRLTMDNYPRYQAVIPDKYETRMRVIKSELLEAVTYVEKYTNTTTHQIRFTSELGQVVLHAEDADREIQASRKVDMKFQTPEKFNPDRIRLVMPVRVNDERGDGPPNIWGMNARYLTAVLQSLNNEFIDIYMNNPKQAFTLKGV